MHNAPLKNRHYCLIMGNSFGYIPEGGWNLKFHPEITPDPSKDSTVDSNLGFEGERKKRGKVDIFM